MSTLYNNPSSETIIMDTEVSRVYAVEILSHTYEVL